MISLSIIIPAYNAELYIERALNSVLHQVGLNDVEILCIDDGSTDDTVSVIETLQTSNNNITLLKQENSGPAAARNLGVKLARGNYVVFLDADDYVVGNAYREVLNKITENQADIVFYGYAIVQPDGKVMRTATLPEKTFHNGLACFRFLHSQFYGPSACMALYRKQFLLNNNLFFPVDTNYEDAHYFRNVSTVSSKTILLNDVFYHYVQYGTSRSKVWNLRNLIDLCELFLADLACLESNLFYDGQAFINTLVAQDDSDCFLRFSSFLRQVLAGVDKVIIYGTGSTGVRLANILSAMHVKGLVFCETSSTRSDNQFMGRDVISPNDIASQQYSDYKILIGSTYIFEIMAVINKVGVGEQVIIPLATDFYHSLKVST
jgi:glycosyltransferase involved in cell wall biosynthesis